MVPHIDLSRKMMRHADPYLAVVGEIMRSGNVLLGPHVAAFEESFSRFVNTRFGIAVSSGASALQLALAAMDIGPGDEVIVPAMTAVPTASAVCAVGARPVIVDIDINTAGIDFECVERVRTQNTKAVIAVHLYGRPIEHLHRLQELGVPVIEDCAQSQGATKELVGSIGAYSFYPTKNLGGIGDGGMVVTDNAEIAERVRRLRVHGQIQQYVHVEISQNHRMSEIEAAWLEIVLPDLSNGNARRKKIVEKYRLAQPSLMWQEDHPDHVHHLVVVRPANRENFREYMTSMGVATGVHYPLALTQQPALREFVTDACPVAEDWAARCVSLPCFPELTDCEVDEVCQALSNAPL